MMTISEKQANWIADLLEAGHIHYEMKDYLFGNAFYRNGRFVEEYDDRQEKKTCQKEFSREEYVQTLVNQPRERFHRFLVRYN